MLNLRIGQVFHLWCTGCKEPKWKYHVLAFIDPRPRFFIINTAMAAFQRMDPDLFAHQISLPETEHKFLRHDSYMNCAEVLGGPTASDLEDLYAKDTNILLGEIATSSRRHARAEISKSILLSEVEKAALLAVW